MDRKRILNLQSQSCIVKPLISNEILTFCRTLSTYVILIQTNIFYHQTKSVFFLFFIYDSHTFAYKFLNVLRLKISIAEAIFNG